LSQEYNVSADVLWQGLVAALPTVITQAAFFDRDRRVEWTTDTTGWSYPQSMTASVEANTDRTSRLTLTGTTRYRAAIGDKQRRTRIFVALSTEIAAWLAHPLLASPETPRAGDEYRWWNGEEWRYTQPEWPPPSS
jgi:hypothetical protein